MKRRRKILIITFFAFFIINLIWILPTIILINMKNQNFSEKSSSNFVIYNVVDLYNILSKQAIFSVEYPEEVVISNNINIKYIIENYNENDKYYIQIKCNDNLCINEEITKNENNFNIQFENEGKKVINIVLYKNDIKQCDLEKDIYYITPYEKQFLDELSNKSVQVHYIDGTWEKYDKSLNMINYIGFKNIKSSFLWTGIEKEEGVYDFSYYDEWVKRANELGINVYACINRIGKWRRQ